MEWPQTRIERLIIPAVFFGIFLFLPLYSLSAQTVSTSTQVTSTSIEDSVEEVLPTKIFHPFLYKNKSDIIATSRASSTHRASVQLSYDFAKQSGQGAIGLTDTANEQVPYLLGQYPQTSEWKKVSILDRYRTDNKDLVVVDMGENNKSTSILKLGINEDAGESLVSVFGTAQYLGLDFTAWDVLARDLPVSKGGKTPLGNTTVQFPTSDRRYLMIALHDLSTSTKLTLGNVYGKNPDYDLTRWNTYVFSNIDEGSQRNTNQTIVTIDTESPLLASNRLDLTLYGEDFITDVKIESSVDNNIWTNRGEDTLYRFTSNKKVFEKTSIEYETTHDRFLRITIGAKGLLIHRLALISGPAQYISWMFDPTRRYTLFYGNPYRKMMDDMTQDVPRGDFFNLGIQEVNPQYIDKDSNNKTGSALEKMNGQRLIAYGLAYPYTEPIILAVIACMILALVAKLLD